MHLLFSHIMEHMSDAAGIDAAILLRIDRRDPKALGDLYTRYSRLVFSIALKILNSSESAEEVTQDVFLQVWHKASSYDPVQGKFSTWISSIARNRAIDHYRRLQVRPESSSIAWEDCCEDNPGDNREIEPTIISSNQRHTLIDAIQTLPEDQQKALSLAYFAGMTQQEISDHLQVPLGTVKTRIRLALQKLRAALDPDYFSNL